MKLLPKPLHHLRRELGVQRIHLARFARGEVNDQKGDDRDKEERDDLLDRAAGHE